MTETHRVCIIAIVLWVLLQVGLGIGGGNDFFAVYLAGKAFALGDFASVYGPATKMFSLDTPAAWSALVAEAGIDPELTLYPYIYPPIWAALSAMTLSQIAPETVLPIVSAVNAALFIGTVALAWRVTRTQQSLVIWLLVGVIFLAATTFGFVPLRQGQWQILTSFLILLSLERARAGAPFQAGAALALATSIKLYPVLLLVLWLARRDQWRNIPAFIITLATLCAASFLLAGPELHLHFIERVATISGSVLYTLLSYNFTVLLDGWTVTGQPGEIGVKITTPWVGLLNKALLLASAATAFWAARRATPDQLYRCTVPIWLVAMSYFSPLSWSYHFLTAMAFAPLLLQRAAGIVGFLTIFALTFTGSAVTLTAMTPTGMLLVCTGSLSLLILVALLYWLRPQNGRTTLPE